MHTSCKDRLPRKSMTGAPGWGEGQGKEAGRGAPGFRTWCLFRLFVASFGHELTASSRMCSLLPCQLLVFEFILV